MDLTTAIINCVNRVLRERQPINGLQQLANGSQLVQIISWLDFRHPFDPKDHRKEIYDSVITEFLSRVYHCCYRPEKGSIEKDTLQSALLVLNVLFRSENSLPADIKEVVDKCLETPDSQLITKEVDRILSSDPWLSPEMAIDESLSGRSTATGEHSVLNAFNGPFIDFESMAEVFEPDAALKQKNETIEVLNEALEALNLRHQETLSLLTEAREEMKKLVEDNVIIKLQNQQLLAEREGRLAPNWTPTETQSPDDPKAVDLEDQLLQRDMETAAEATISLQALCDELGIGANNGSIRETRALMSDAVDDKWQEREAYWRSRYEVLVVEKTDVETKLLMVQKEFEADPEVHLKKTFELLRLKYKTAKENLIKTQDALIDIQTKLSLSQNSLAQKVPEKLDLKAKVNRDKTKSAVKSGDKVKTVDHNKDRKKMGDPPAISALRSSPPPIVQKTLPPKKIITRIVSKTIPFERPFGQKAKKSTPVPDKPRRNNKGLLPAGSASKSLCNWCRTDLATFSQAARYQHQTQECPARKGRMAAVCAHLIPDPQDDSGTGSSPSSSQRSSGSTAPQKRLREVDLFEGAFGCERDAKRRREKSLPRNQPVK